MGALPRRPLGMGAILGLDVGFIRALGLGSLSLRPLVPLQRFVGVVARASVRASLLPSDLVAGVRFFLRVRQRRLWLRFRICGMAADRPLRSVLPLVRTLPF